MSTLGSQARDAGRRARREAQDADWVDHAARIGLVAFGVVHLVIAWLAVQLAFGDRQGSASSQGAVRQLAQQPFGSALVWAVGIGMFLLAAWQAVEAAVGHRDEDGFTLVRKRVTSAAKVVIYAGIGVSAVRAALAQQDGGGSGGSSGGSGGGTDTWTARLMDLPAGQLLVGAVGLAIVGIGGYLVHRGWSEDFADNLTADGRSGASGTAYVWCGKAGYTAKGVAYGIVGVLFVVAAVRHQPKKSGGLDQALTELLKQPFGPVLLTLVALGFAAYGVFCFARARHLSRS